MKDAIKTKEVGDYRISIYYDECYDCPVTDWDMAGCYLWEYNRLRRLSEYCDWKEVWGKYGDSNHSLCESLAELVRDHCDFDKLWDYIKTEKMSNVRLNYDRSEKMWKLSIYGYGIFDLKSSWSVITGIEPYQRVEKNWDVFEDLFSALDYEDFVELINLCGKDVYVTDWSTTGYSQGDYVGGIAFCTKARYDERCGRTDIPWTEAIQECIDKEVDCIGKWMWGDVYGYVLEKKVCFTKVYEDESMEDEDDYEWEEVFSCWGYYMKPDELIEEVMALHDIKEEDAA